MGVHSFDDLRQHVGHETEVVMYAEGCNVAIECLDCCEVLVDYDYKDGPEFWESPAITRQAETLEIRVINNPEINKQVKDSKIREIYEQATETLLEDITEKLGDEIADITKRIELLSVMAVMNLLSDSERDMILGVHYMWDYNAKLYSLLKQFLINKKEKKYNDSNNPEIKIKAKEIVDSYKHIYGVDVIDIIEEII